MPVVYRVDWFDNHEGHLIEWWGTKAEAERAAMVVGDGDVARKVIPRRKSDLIRWLNANIHHDNG